MVLAFPALMVSPSAQLFLISECFVAHFKKPVRIFLGQGNAGMEERISKCGISTKMSVQMDKKKPVSTQGKVKNESLVLES